MSKYTADQQAKIDFDKRDPQFLNNYINSNAALLQPHNSGGSGVEMRCPCCTNKIFAFYGTREGKSFIKSHNGQCSDFNEYNDVFALMAAVKFGRVDGNTCIRAMDEHVGYSAPDPSKYVKRDLSKMDNAPKVSLPSREQSIQIDNDNLEICRKIFERPPTAIENAMLVNAYSQRGLDYNKLPSEVKANVRFVSDLHIKSKSTGRLRKTPIRGVIFRSGCEGSLSYEVRCTDSNGIFISKDQEKIKPEPGKMPMRRFEAIGPKSLSGVADLDKTTGPLHIFEGRFNEHTAKICGCTRAVSFGGASVNFMEFTSQIKEHCKDGNLVFIDFDRDKAGKERGEQLEKELSPLNVIVYSPVPADFNDVNDFYKADPERCTKRIKEIPDKLNDMFAKGRLTVDNVNYIANELSKMQNPESENTIQQALSLIEERQNTIRLN